MYALPGAELKVAPIIISSNPSLFTSPAELIEVPKNCEISGPVSVLIESGIILPVILYS